MNILYIGDVMGEIGVQVVSQVLPDLRAEKKIDLVIAQSENVTEGRGMSVADFERLQALGIDVCTGGNWTPYRKELHHLLEDPTAPVMGPANMHDSPGPGYKYVMVNNKKVLVISLLGKIVGRDADAPVDNPLQKIDEILHAEIDVPRAATIVNFHGDFSSEKYIIGHYLDGRVSVIVGDHWHVPTADAQILPKGTAHQTDVGMCGSLDSSLGITFGSVVPRWRDGVQTKNVLETEGRMQFNALFVDYDEQSGKTRAVEQLRSVFTA